MTWNIAQAKQQFSEVVRLSAQEPQAIYNRDTAVAAVISAVEYEQFKQWRLTLNAPSLAQQFLELRHALEEVGDGQFHLPPRSSIGRENSFVRNKSPVPRSVKKK
jgi:PHD/YefM family antitoxin component YafN of YafNO toxin-antitoxin module